jgi:hypothetical protein
LQTANIIKIFFNEDDQKDYNFNSTMAIKKERNFFKKAVIFSLNQNNQQF